jgi:tetratricopeptide (TPR) repeat protein
LTKIEQVCVVARTTAFSFKGKTGDVREIGRTLGVTSVLEGSVRKAGNRLRVSAQLVNVADGYHVWSDRYDRQLEDVFEIQDEISLAIVNALKVKLLGGEREALAKRQTLNVEAYQLYLQGRHYWHKWTADSFAKSMEYMKRAIEVDPEYALAYCGIADVYLAGAAGYHRYIDIRPDARAALKRALDLDSELDEAWTLTAVANMFEWNWEVAEKAGARATESSLRPCVPGPGAGGNVPRGSARSIDVGKALGGIGSARATLELGTCVGTDCRGRSRQRGCTESRSP